MAVQKLGTNGFPSDFMSHRAVQERCMESFAPAIGPARHKGFYGYSTGIPALASNAAVSYSGSPITPE